MHFCSGLDSEGEADNRIALGEMLGWLPGVTKTWLTGTRGCREGNAGGERAPFAHTPSMLSIAAPVPQPVYKSRSMRRITQEFCPYPLVSGHWRSFPSCIPSLHPSILQWMLYQRVLGSHAQCIFHALGTPLSGSSGECVWQDVSTHLSTDVSAEIRC